MEGKYPNERRIRVVLLCGGDMVESFTRKDETSPNGKLWNPEHLTEILTEYGLVVVDRAGAKAQETLMSERLAFLHGLLGNVAIIQDETFPNEMSSTRLRDAIRQGRSIQYCTPDSVVEYIKYNGLYTKQWELEQKEKIERDKNEGEKS